MIKFTKYKAILWDFDGVLMDSMPVRDHGFEQTLAEYPVDQVKELLDYHRQNGGLSRYVKFKYFFEEIRGESVTDAQILQLATRFSSLMRQSLIDESLLISDSLDFVKQYYERVPMHVVSGSDQDELRYLCGTLGLDQYFKSVHGSPTPKKQLIPEIVRSNRYQPSALVLIGDSVNDWEAAVENQIDFMGYNNVLLKGLGSGYISSFEQILV